MKYKGFLPLLIRKRLKIMEKKKMPGAVLPGNSTVELKEFDIPEPGFGQVLVKTKCTTSGVYIMSIQEKALRAIRE